MTTTEARINFKLSCYTHYENKIISGLQMTHQVKSFCYWRKVKYVSISSIGVVKKQRLEMIAKEVNEKERECQQLIKEIRQTEANLDEQLENLQIPSSKAPENQGDHQEIPAGKIKIELTRFVINLKIKSRPSIFRNVPIECLFSGYRGLRIILRDITTYYAKKNPKYWHCEDGITSNEEHFEIVGRNLLSGGALADEFIDAVKNVDPTKLRYLKNNIQELWDMKLLYEEIKKVVIRIFNLLGDQPDNKASKQMNRKKKKGNQGKQSK